MVTSNVHARPTSVVQDARFQKVHNDPRFARVNKKKTKLQIDKRFAAALQDEKFQGAHAKYDKYGRRIKSQSRALSRFYELEEEHKEDEEEDADDEKKKKKRTKEQTKATRGKAKAKQAQPESEEEEDEEEEDDDEDPEMTRLEYLNRMARGELSSDSESDSDVDDDDEEDHDDSELAKEKEVIPMGEETKRFAVLNCDWSRIRAVDIFALCQSFAPETGAVLDVTVYPSDYGLEKMKEEETVGPQMLLEAVSNSKKKKEKQEETQEDEDNSDDGDNDSDKEEEEQHKDQEEVEGDQEDQEDQEDDDNEEEEEEEEYDSDDPLQVKTRVTEEDMDDFDKEKLREYELQKLKYFYAVVTCDSVKTASAIVDQCDLMEYEASANVLDLRFVPDDVTFTNAPREQCQQVPDQYKPVLFATSALQQTEVKLTWEADDQQRRELLTRPTDWKRVEDDDFAAYIASDNSSDSDSDAAQPVNGLVGTQDDKKQRKVEQLKQRYRQMLLGSDAEDASDDDKVQQPGDSDLDSNSDSDSKSEDKQDLAMQFAAVASDKEDEDENGNKEMRFTPGAADILKNKKRRDQHATETPYEKYQREKKELKNKKLHDKRNQQKQLQQEQRQQLKLGKRKAQQAKAQVLAGHVLEEADHHDNEEEEEEEEEAARDFDMKAIAKREKLGQKKLSGKRKAKELRKLAAQGAALQETFEFDAQDPRFAALYAKGGDFAIDPTDPKFKKTQAAEEIFKQRRKQLDQEQRDSSNAHAAAGGPQEEDTSGALQQMVAKLKRKHVATMDTKKHKRSITNGAATTAAGGKNKKLKKHA